MLILQRFIKLSTAELRMTPESSTSDDRFLNVMLSRSKHERFDISFYDRV